MSLTASELSFLRLLERTKKLAREDLAENVWKVNAAVLYLENLYSRLQDEKTLHNGDLLMQYGRELNQMKLLVEAERCVSSRLILTSIVAFFIPLPWSWMLVEKKSAEEKLSQLDLIPRRFPDTGIELHSSNTSSKGCLFFSRKLEPNSTRGEFLEPASYRPLETVSEVRVRNRAVYRADLRKQLLGEEKQRRQNASASDDLVQHEEKQESIANELLSLTRSLKQNMTVAGNVLKDDNKRLSSMHAQVDANTAQLKTEGTRLAHHAYKCGFDCALVFVALFIFWSFICMVVVMKIFPKRVTS
ncbi:unnamed protein product [Haemonchus placei]|uniref:Vesicle transport protein USE1 n=1 Tax=Haemonchus placei TaxID=6290 RepID=A0A0N4WX04_HAEPC|nr:unnamed protein product [Haemonchus placei]